MTEAEIAALVAQVLATRDAADTSFGDALLRNGELIVAAFGLVVGGIAWLVANDHRKDKRIQSLEEYRTAHEAHDKAAHGHLESEIGNVGRELREFRQESTAQHSELGGQVKGMARDLNRLIGYHEAKEDRR